MMIWKDLVVGILAGKPEGKGPLGRPRCVLFFIYGLFNDADSSSTYIASNDRMINNNEMERIWKESVVA
jgi:hypothetical protein